ncbi:hypothetical protein M0812_04055 [Anaeramoeba flamelloides]|nr:hypothetical protein M0812_04055 [Anaeramoeba flamelloides]
MENEKTLKELHINRTGEFFLMISKQFIDLYQDISLKKCWSKMLSNPILSDTKILEKPAHQLILKLRTKHENIEKLVEQMNQTFDKQQAQLFLNWAYFAELTH